MFEVVEVDPHDEALLREFWATEQAAIRHDRPDAVIRTFDALRHSTRTPGPFHRRALGRTAVCGEVYVPPGDELETSGPGRFALAMGLTSAHQEDHLVLKLPVDGDQLLRLHTPVAGHASSYDVVTWGDRCPEEHVPAYCAMNTQMSADVPSGELAVEPVVWDEARVRSGEERTARSYRQVVAAARRRHDGVWGGYSKLYLPHGADHVLQDDTHPDRRAVHTWTEPGNAAMHRTNIEFGFVVVERMHEMQRRDSG